MRLTVGFGEAEAAASAVIGGAEGAAAFLTLGAASRVVPSCVVATASAHESQ